MKKLEKVPEKGFYYHYKHDLNGDFNNYSYEVIGVGHNTEENTYTILYRPLYKNDFMEQADYQSRPFDMFTGDVVLNGKTIRRFQKITDQKTIAELEKIRMEMYGV